MIFRRDLPEISDWDFDMDFRLFRFYIKRRRTIYPRSISAPGRGAGGGPRSRVIMVNEFE